jgi:imidazole glycerol phosphate synthase glutamine amidotransferase subunit
MVAEVDLVDIGGGNRGSVMRLMRRLDLKFRAVGPENPPDGTRPIVLPGVGSFGAVMAHVCRSGLDQIICDLVRAGTPYLGICVGLQALFDESDESPGVPGLGILAGRVKRFSAGKVPQIGWNLISDHSGRGWESGYAYFVNSYFVQPQSREAVLYEADYFERFCAGVLIGNIAGFQFHPEKSGQFGELLMKKWLASV